ncbi:development-specific protein LVN1.2-like [Patiria miniata]|uniref:Uncharacterized protein n=1 Tax=Patiria miniata TaxID=46514 RepID=A0A914A7R1_PATMI|nr:development-specific protein LVN1.2-like [Patiria miniata]
MSAKTIVFLFLVALATSHAQAPAGPCCYPDQFVIAYGSQSGISHFGTAAAIGIFANSAFDFTNKMIGEEGTLVVEGQPPKDYKVIQDYAQGVQYTIDRGESKCDKTKLAGPMQHCVPGGAIFNATAYLGDKKLNIDSYYYVILTPQQQGRLALSVTQGDCLPNSYSFTGKAGPTSILTVTGYFNYVQGIADPSAFFDVPDYCPSYITAESELLKQLKYQRVQY